ncbi:hypothetical protein ACSBR2_016716 [Camellia fascicularis]
MPRKFYHGRTGQVWNVTKRAIGVEMNKWVTGSSTRGSMCASNMCSLQGAPRTSN